MVAFANGPASMRWARTRWRSEVQINRALVLEVVVVAFRRDDHVVVHLDPEADRWTAIAIEVLP